MVVSRTALPLVAALLFVGSALLSAPSARAVGGPDLDNYIWISQDDDDGPKYDWIEISATGTMATYPTSCSWSGPTDTDWMPLGFSRPYNWYGRQYLQARATLHGNLLFEPPGPAPNTWTPECDGQYVNCGIATTQGSPWLCQQGSATGPNWQIGALWSGFGIDPSVPKSGIYYQTVCEDGSPPATCVGHRVFIAEWYYLKSCPFITITNKICANDSTAWGSNAYVPGIGNTFEVKLFEDGRSRAEVHYKDMDRPLSQWGGSPLVMGAEGSGKKGKAVGVDTKCDPLTIPGKKPTLFHGIAYKNLNINGGTATYYPKQKWAIRYAQDAPPIADFAPLSLPSNIYHDGILEDDINALPVPEPSYFHAPDQILFSDRSSDGDGYEDIKTWTWDLGDGNFSDVANPTHSYGDIGDGIFTVRVNLTVSDGIATSPLCSRVLSFYPNMPPDVIFDTPRSPRAGTPTPFTDLSTDTDGHVVQWMWDFGDNAIARLPAQVMQPLGDGSILHTYDQAGMYHVTLRGIDDDGASDIYETTINVVPAHGALDPTFEDPPQAFAGDDRRVEPGSFVQMHGYQTNGHAEVYKWAQVSGPRVELRDTDTGDPSFVAPQLYSDAKGHLIPARIGLELTVTDKGRLSAPDTVIFTVAPPDHLPAARAGDDQVVLPNTLVTLDASASTDSDGDVLTADWVQLSGPPVTLTAKAPMGATFMAPSMDDSVELVFRADVNDGQGGVSPATVKVTVGPGEDGFAASSRGPGVFAFSAKKLGAEYTWSFGDGQTSSEPAPVHTYAKSGSYSVHLDLVDLDGNTESYTRTVTAYVQDAATASGQAGRGAPALAMPLMAVGLGLLVLAMRRKEE